MSKLSSKSFRKRIRKREKQCRLCGRKNRLHVAHIKSRFFYPELRNNDSNAIILCGNCEKKYGSKLMYIAETEKDINSEIIKKIRRLDF